jgi:hypothetical protein
LGVGVWGHVIFGSIDWGTTVINQVVQETFITGFCWLGVALLLSLGMRAKAPQWQILNGLLGLTVVLKTLFTALQFGWEFSLFWLTAGAFWGMLFATVVLRWALQLSSRVKQFLAVFCLVGATIAINVMPDNPYFILTLRHWYQGRLLHFNDLMQWVSVIWLPLATVWMIRNITDLKSRH